MEKLSVEAGETFLNISWLLPLKNNECVSNYSVKVIDDMNFEKIDITADKLYYNAEYLQPCAKYTIIVVARGKENIGSSEKSIIENTTKSVGKFFFLGDLKIFNFSIYFPKKLNY